LFLNGYPHIEAVGLANTRWKPDAGLRKCDLTDFEELEYYPSLRFRKVFIEEKPAFFVHAAAERRPDVAEKNQEGTTAINLE
jgi:S-adenosylmethionine synthetase